MNKENNKRIQTNQDNLMVTECVNKLVSNLSISTDYLNYLLCTTLGSRHTDWSSLFRAGGGGGGGGGGGAWIHKTSYKNS